jgi:hypothetical protein
MQNTNLNIHPELETLLPRLTEMEFAGLEESILKDGCLSPLVVWNNTLIDGYHRYEICRIHQIPFSVKNVVFESLDDAKLWIWKHQENRRNLTAFQRAEIALKLKEAVAAKARGRQGKRNDLKENNIPATLPECKETRQELAEIADVGSRTLDKAEFIAEHADEVTKEKLRRGEKGTSINKEYTRLKAELETKNPPKTAKSQAGKKKPTAKKSIEPIPVATESRKNLPTNYCCGVKFEPDPGDTYYDWLTDEERKEFLDFQKHCVNPVYPSIRNLTIQNIPEHKPDPLVNCLYFLFKPLYREKFAFALLRRMLEEPDDRARAVNVINTMYHEINNR